MTDPGRSNGGVTSILFVCMGNICRSPLAECIFRYKATALGVADRFHIDSAGTGAWHTGAPPDPRVQDLLARHRIPISGTASRVDDDDFERFDHILCADNENRDDLLERGGPERKIRLLLECDPDASCLEIPDPYHGGDDGFELVRKLVDPACDRLLEELLREMPAVPNRGSGTS